MKISAPNFFYPQSIWVGDNELTEKIWEIWTLDVCFRFVFGENHVNRMISMRLII
jgi:hypothetical protein